MICKWCGSNLKRTDASCPSCGQKTPPLSDCGGLYDLRFAPKDPPPAPVVTPTASAAPENDRFAREMARQEAARRNRNWLILLAVCAFMTLCVVVLLFRLNSLNSKYAALENKISAMEENKDTTEPSSTETISDETEPVIPENTDPTKPEDVPEETQPVIYTVDLTLDGENCTEDHEFGNFAQNVDFDSEVNNNNFTATYTTKGEQEDSEPAVFVKLDLKTNENKKRKSWDRTLTVDIDPELFENPQYTYLWEYSLDGEVWEEIPEQYIDNQDKVSNISLHKADFLDTLENETGYMDLRCKVEISNLPQEQPEEQPEEESLLGQNMLAIPLPGETVSEETISEETVSEETEPEIPDAPVEETEKCEKLVITINGMTQTDIQQVLENTIEQENEQ